LDSLIPDKKNLSLLFCITDQNKALLIKSEALYQLSYGLPFGARGTYVEVAVRSTPKAAIS